MTSTPQDGGAAFPVVCVGDAGRGHNTGMSLHDWFAGQALAGLCAHYGGMFMFGKQNDVVEAYAKSAMTLADAMLLARSRQRGEK